MAGGRQKVLPTFDTRLVGTIFEIDPVLGADDNTIDISFHFEHHTAPPEQEMTQIRLPDTESNIEFPLPVFHSKSITTQITMQNGTTRIIGVYRPSGMAQYQQEKSMEIVFLKGNVIITEKPVFLIREQ